MKRLLKWAGLLVGGLVAVVLLAAGALYVYTESRLETTYDVQPSVVPVPTDSAALARGRHVAVTRGCTDCHGDDLSGAVVIDEPPVGRLPGSNLTPAGVGSSYTDVDWVRGIRHGVGPDGRPLVFMPSHEFYYLSDEDLGALIAYLKQVDPVESELPDKTVGPVARLLYTTGEMHLIPAEMIPHDAPRPDTPAPGPTAEYGEYLAVGCTNCHGEGFSGGPIPGGPPDWPPAKNLTPDEETGLGTWTEDNFFRAMREGVRPDGTQLSEVMPVRMTSRMTDEELRAIWRFLQRLPPREQGRR